MRLSIKIVFFLFGTLNLFAQDCKAKLIINTDFSPIIFVDDSLISNSQYSEFELSAGYHKIIVSENENYYNKEVIKDYIILNNCDIVEKKYSLEKETFMDSNPQDAAVFYNDSLIGFTPILLNKSIKNLTLKKENYLDFQLDIDNYQNKIIINLIRLNEVNSQRFFSSTLFKLLTGAALTLSAVSVYYKLKADDKFDEYKKSKNQQLLDETNKYDTISDITFIGLQINLGYIIYRLLTE